MSCNACVIATDNVTVGITVMVELMLNLSLFSALVTDNVAFVRVLVLGDSGVSAYSVVTYFVAAVIEDVGCLAYSTALIALGITIVRVEMSIEGSFVSAIYIVTYSVAGVIVYVRGVANVTATEVTVGVTSVIECVIHDSYMYAIEVVTLGVALIAICVRSSSDNAADVTVNVTIVGISVGVSRLTAYIAIGVARICVYVLGLAIESANAARIIAVVVKAMRCFAIEAADVTVGVAGIVESMSNISRIITAVARSVAVVIEGVKTFPRSDKGDSLRGRVSIEVPEASVRESPTDESIALLYGKCRLIYKSAGIYSDMAEIRAIVRVKGYSHLIAFRRATDSNRTHDGYQGE